MTVEKKTFWIPIRGEQPLVELRGLDAEAFNEMRAAMDAARPDIRADIDKKIGRAVEIVRSFDPIPLLVHVALKNGVSAPGQEQPKSESAPTIRIEYALSLILSVPDDEKRAEPPPEVEAEFESLVSEILDLTTMYFLTEGTAEGKYSLDEAELRSLSLMHMLNVRGDARQAHALDVFRAVAAPHDEFLRERFGFSAEEFVSTVLEIERQIVSALTAWGEVMRTQSALDKRFDEWSETDGKQVPEERRPEAVLKLPGIRQQIDAAQELAARLPPAPFEIVANENALAAVLQGISATLGDNAAFLTGPSSGWPTNGSLIAERPILRRAGRWFAFGAAALLENVLSILESAIRQADNKYWEASYTKKRGDVVEQLACRHIEALLPGAQIYRNVFFESSAVKRFETDAIILFGRTLLVVETKAGALARSARRGGLGAIKKDVALLIKAAHDQASRVADVIALGEAVFRYGDGSVAVTIPGRSDLRDVFFVNVTLANLAHLATRLSTAKRLDLLSSDDWPWSVCVTDLRVMSEILDGPSEFLAYLHARRRANDAGGAVTPDENDFLMAFLRNGFAELDEARERGATVTLMMNETGPLDRYYVMLDGYIDEAPKPTLDLPEELVRMIRGLERLGPDGAELAADLLLVPRAVLRSIGENLAEMLNHVRSTGESRDVTIPPHPASPVGITIATGRIRDANEWVSRIRAYVTLKKYHEKASKWICIGVGIGEDDSLDYQAVLFVGDWHFDERLSSAAVKLFGTSTIDEAKPDDERS